MSVMSIVDNFHYFHHGVESRPAWAYNDARQQIAGKWAEFLKAMPDTANVTVQNIVFQNLGGSISRIGTFPKDFSVSGAGSKTTNSGGRVWEAWFDLHYEFTMYFIPSGGAINVDKGRSEDEINKSIAVAALI